MIPKAMGELSLMEFVALNNSFPGAFLLDAVE
jgi:hypothetical protein